MNSDDKINKNKKLASESKTSQASYLRVLWVNKILIVITIMSLLFMFGAIGAALSLLPLKTIETKYVEFSTSDNNFVTIETAGNAIQTNHNLISLLLKKYVVDREKVNHIDEDERYKYVYALSTESVGTKFKTFYGGKDALVHKEHILREIKLGPITPIGKNIVIIDFATVDTNYKKKKIEGDKYQPMEHQWQATMKYTFSAQNVKEEEKELNPIGLFVTRYQASERRY